MEFSKEKKVGYYEYTCTLYRMYTIHMIMYRMQAVNTVSGQNMAKLLKAQYYFLS